MHLMLTDAIGKLEVQLKEQNKSLEDVSFGYFFFNMPPLV